MTSSNIYCRVYLPRYIHFKLDVHILMDNMIVFNLDWLHLKSRNFPFKLENSSLNFMLLASRTLGQIDVYNVVLLVWCLGNDILLKFTESFYNNLNYMTQTYEFACPILLMFAKVENGNCQLLHSMFKKIHFSRQLPRADILGSRRICFYLIQLI